MPMGRQGENQGLPVMASNLGNGYPPGKPWDEAAVSAN